MKKRFYAIIVVILYLIIFVPFPPLPNISVPKVHAGSPNLVDMSTNYEATAYNFQRKTFYANGRFWVFYSDGTNIVYRTSTNGITWSNTTIVRGPYNTYDGTFFSIYFDGIYLHYVFADGTDGDGIYYRRGIPNADGTITWSAAEQTAVAGVSGTTYTYPTIAVDTNGYVWIGYQRYDGTYYYPYVTRSGNNDGTWGTTPSGFPYQLSATSSYFWVVDVQPLTAGKVFVIYMSDQTYVQVWTGSAWTTETIISITTNNLNEFSAISQGDNVHIVMTENTWPYDLVYFRYTYSNNSFNSFTTLLSTSDNVAPIISRNNDDLYVFWADAQTNHIYYRHYNAATSTWDATVDWIDESSAKFTDYYDISAFYLVSNGYVGVVYETGSRSPYSVKFVYSTFTLKYGNFQAPSTVYANKYFLLNATVNDANGVADIINASINLSNNVVLLWTRATNTFSIYRDPNNYVTLDTAGSFSTQLNSTAYKLTFKLKLGLSYPKGYTSINPTYTKAYSTKDYVSASALNIFNFVNLPHAILKSVYFDSSGNPIFNIVSSADNSIITSFSQRKINNNTWLIYNIQNGISNTTVNVYERKYGPYTFRVAADNNATIPFNLISDTEGKIDFNVTGPTTVKVWLGIIGEPYQVLRDNTVWTNWTWDNTNHVLSVNITASRITLVWNINPNPSRGGGGGGGGGAGGSSGGGTGGGGRINQPTIPIPEIPNGLITLGIVAILIILMLVFAYGKIEENKDINRLFKKRFSKPLPKIDMKKKRKSLW